MADNIVNITVEAPVLLRPVRVADYGLNIIQAGPRGVAGKQIELASDENYLLWRYVGNTEWTVLVELANLAGTDGREIQLQVTQTDIQWRYSGETEWTNLVELAALKGDQGDAFEYEDFTPEQLAALKGDKGDAFEYGDFTPEQLAALKGDKGDAFEYGDFTPEQLAALKGDKGDAFEYTDFTPEQLEALKGEDGSDATVNATNIATVISGISADTIADADTVPWYQSIGGALKKITWANIKATLKTYFDGLYFALSNNTLLKDPTGFIDPDNIGVSYSAANRTITLTHSSGVIQYMWNGVLKQLTSPWTSTDHAIDAVGKYLSTTDGTTFAWSDGTWELYHLQVAYVPGHRLYAFREVHGCMQWKMHELWHVRIGTIRRSGGGLVAGTFALQPANPADADNTPTLAACTIADEDCNTSLALFPEGTYTLLWFTSTGAENYDTTATKIFRVTGTYPNYNPFGGTNFSETEASNTRYLNYYVIRIPVTSDSDSQKYRAVILQPQFQYTSLTSAQAEDVKALNLGTLSTVAPEFILVERITLRTNNTYGSTGKVRIEAQAILVGDRNSQVAVSGITPTTAENVSVTGNGSNVSGNVQSSLENLDTNKQVTGSYPTSSEITIIKQLTAAEYAALNPKVSTTLYVIVG